MHGLRWFNPTCTCRWLTPKCSECQGLIPACTCSMANGLFQSESSECQRLIPACSRILLVVHSSSCNNVSEGFGLAAASAAAAEFMEVSECARARFVAVRSAKQLRASLPFLDCASNSRPDRTGWKEEAHSILGDERVLQLKTPG